ncbi:unnamed protein product [Peniophora sp. CBMAI 1063]|nr:unnamed protein product [Peniophora sp. CBMAI 1063]
MLTDSSARGARSRTNPRTIFLSSVAFTLLLVLLLSAHLLGISPLFAPSNASEHAREQTVVDPLAGPGGGRASRPLSIRAAGRLQDQLNAKTSMHRRPTCLWTPWQDARYAPLRDTNRRIVIAMLLHKNSNIISSLAQELPVVLEWLGVHSVFVSVYESGSDDRSKEWLGDLGKILDAMGVQHHIVAFGDSRHENTEGNRRIPVIAAARNAALAPLHAGQVRSALGGEPDEMFFINDIFFCASDLLEILLQYRKQGMHQACATDWDELVYDRWVLRAISGRPWWRQDQIMEYFGTPNDHPKELPGTLLDEEVDRRRWELHLPLQVFSCWNGATVIDAKVFLPPHSIRFRQSRADWEDESLGIPLNLTSKASESYLSSVDLWKAGFTRIAIIPKASVAYRIHTYDKFRKDGESFAPMGDDEVFEWIGNWKESPPEEVVNQDYAYWHVAERLGHWNEQ